MAAESSSTLSKKGTTKHGCWGNCVNDTRYPERLPPGTYFIPFPKVGKIKDGMTQCEKNKQNDKIEKAKKWIHACSRIGFGIQNIKGHTYICSNHFIGGSGPTEEYPDPILATLTEAEISKRSKKRKAPAQRRQPLPHSKLCKKAEAVNAAENTIPENEINTDIEKIVEPELLTKDAATQTDLIMTLTESSQTEPDKLAITGCIENVILKNEISVLKSQQSIMLSPTVGLTSKQFWIFYEFLEGAKFNLNYWNSKKGETFNTTKVCSLSVAQQLFITLLRLRRGFNIMTIAHFYCVSETTIRTIFTTWIMFMFHHFQSICFEFFSERQAFQKFLPKVFKHFKNIRASVDCTEFKCQTPRNYKQQGHLYSSYKSHCTM